MLNCGLCFCLKMLEKQFSTQKINMRLISAIMLITSLLLLIKSTHPKTTGSTLEKGLNNLNFTPKFKKHGVWHFYNFDAKQVDERIPLESQLFEFPDSEKFDSVDVKKVEKMLGKYISQSKSISIKPGEGTGIVICGHDGVSLELYALISYIREYSDMKVELYHAGDLGQTNQEYFSEFKDVDIINLKNNHLYFSKDLGKESKDPRKYYIKPLAMLSTNFENVIYLDSDAFPLLHLDKFILEKALKYLDTVDMLIFRDYWMMHDTNPVFDILSEGYASQRQADSGVMVYKKSQSVNVLLLSYFISAEKYFDLLFFGDKDTFWFANAYLQSKRKYTHLHCNIYMNLEMVGYLGDTINDIGMMHTIDSKPAFAHLNGVKFVLDHWKDFGIDVLERSFDRLEAVMIKSPSDNFDDSYTQHFMSYRHRQFLLLNHQMLEIKGKKIFKFYKKSFELTAKRKTSNFLFKSGCLFACFIMGAAVLVKSIVVGLNYFFDRRKLL